jgi:propanediol dehydratase medium subunit
VVEALVEGIRQQDVPVRLVRVRDTADCAFIGHEAARLSGSGIAIGIQSRGTAVIHRRDLAPLDNLELLSHAPNLTLDSYRRLGGNAAAYALGERPEPVPVRVDNMARLKHIVHSTLLHRVEVEAVTPGARAIELTVRPTLPVPARAGSPAEGA